MGHAADADELPEVPGEELEAVIDEDTRRGAGELFASVLEDGFNVAFLHFVAESPVNDEAAPAVEDGADEAKRAGAVEVTDIDMSVFVGLQGLDKASVLPGE